METRNEAWHRAAREAVDILTKDRRETGFFFMGYPIDSYEDKKKTTINFSFWIIIIIIMIILE